MSFSQNNQQVPRYTVFEIQNTEGVTDPKKLVRSLMLRMNRIIDTLNKKRMGARQLNPEANGESYAPAIASTTGVPTYVMEQTYYAGPLANVGALNIAHGITWSATTYVVAIDAWATNTTASYSIPLPYVDVSSTPVTGNIELYVGATNIVITSAGNASAFNKVIVTLRWIQE